MFISSALIQRSSYNHLLHSASATKTTTELLNLLSFSKSARNWTSDFTASTGIALVISLLAQYVTPCTLDGQTDENMALVKFVVEQLRLYLSPKLGRRYSVELITTSFLWQLTSTALYQKLRWLVIVPSVSRLRQISSGINVETGKLDVAHTKQRICNLSPTERKVVLIVNEVYITQRIEYCNGQFRSLTKDGIPAKNCSGLHGQVDNWKIQRRQMFN